MAVPLVRGRVKIETQDSVPQTLSPFIPRIVILDGKKKNLWVSSVFIPPQEEIAKLYKI